MDPEVERLAQEIARAYDECASDTRLLIAVAGAPGSGKSTLAYPLTAHLNSILRDKIYAKYGIDEATGLTDVDTSEGPKKAVGDKGDLAVCVGLDGWHYTRAELDAFEDPKVAHWRRGASFTFNLPSYLAFLQQLRLPLDSPSVQGIPFPTFDHAAKDPAPSPVPITPQHRIVVMEGLYTLLDKPGWRECAAMMDMRVWVETDRDVCRTRLINRNFSAGIVSDLKACAERVDASDMVNGDEVRDHKYSPSYTITPVDNAPGQAGKTSALGPLGDEYRRS